MQNRAGHRDLQAAIRTFGALLGLIVFALAGMACAADVPDVASASAVVMDASTGAVLFEKDADSPGPPANMGKLMTLDVVFRALKDGRVKFEDEYSVSQNAYKKGGDRSGTTTMFLPANSSARVADLITGIAVASANDACIVLAEGLSGSEASFIEAMTEQGKRLGLTHSHFTNVTGLPDADHVMSTRDLALVAQDLITTYSDYYGYFAQRNFQVGSKLLLNKNPLLSLNIGFDGLKTGATAGGGLGIVASIQSEGRRLIIVLNGARSESDRTADARKLADWAFKSFKAATIFDDGEVISEARVWGGTRWFVPVLAKGEAQITVPRGAAQSIRLKASLVYQGPLHAPVRKGDPVGYLRVESTEGGLVSRLPVYAGADIDKSSVLARGLDSLLIMSLGWVLR